MYATWEWNESNRRIYEGASAQSSKQVNVVSSLSLLNSFTCFFVPEDSRPRSDSIHSIRFIRFIRFDSDSPSHQIHSIRIRFDCSSSRPKAPLWAWLNQPKVRLTRLKKTTKKRVNDCQLRIFEAAGKSTD